MKIATLVLCTALVAGAATTFIAAGRQNPGGAEAVGTAEAFFAATKPYTFHLTISAED
jgi:hypothetical protein